MDPLEIVRKRIAYYENGKAEMALYEARLLKKTEWMFDHSPVPFEATPFQMGFDFPPKGQKEKIDCVLDELRLIEKEMMKNEIHKDERRTYIVIK